MRYWISTPSFCTVYTAFSLCCWYNKYLSSSSSLPHCNISYLHDAKNYLLNVTYTYVNMSTDIFESQIYNLNHFTNVIVCIFVLCTWGVGIVLLSKSSCCSFNESLFLFIGLMTIANTVLALCHYLVLSINSSLDFAIARARSVSFQTSTQFTWQEKTCESISLRRFWDGIEATRRLRVEANDVRIKESEGQWKVVPRAF